MLIAVSKNIGNDLGLIDSEEPLKSRLLIILIL